MTVNEAYKVLRVDDGSNYEVISYLTEALPGYIEATTGMSESDQMAEPLVDVVSGLLLTQWYYADHADDQALTRTINSLLKVITLKAKRTE